MHVAVVLHGSNGSAADVWPLATALRHAAPVFVPDLIGHGGRPISGLPELRATAEDVIAQIDARGYDKVFFVGYSLGGTLGLYLARHYPERVVGVASIAAKVEITQEVIDKWVYLIDPERLGRPDNPRQFELERIHFPQAWRDVARANRAMFLKLLDAPPLTDADLAAITCPTLTLNGTQDQLVPKEESKALVVKLRGAGGFFQGAAHPLQVIPLAPVGKVIGEWIQAVEAGKAPGQPGFVAPPPA